MSVRRMTVAPAAVRESVSGMESENAAAVVRHIVDNQIKPQLLADELRAEGVVDVESFLVSTDPGAIGFEVRCVRCGRTARMASKPPEGKQPICPPCLRKAGLL